MGETTKIEWCDSRRFGPLPNPPRDGDKKQARQRINVEVRTGKRPHPNELPCVECGHIWVPMERRHEYDHHWGYAAEHHYHVEAVCTLCHSKRDGLKSNAVECVHGHTFTESNTITRKNGTRQCRECRRIKDRGRRDAAFWREYRKKRATEGTFRVGKKKAGRELDGRTWDQFPEFGK